MKCRILSYHIPLGHRHTVIATTRSECCLEFITYTSDYRMFHGLMGSEGISKEGGGGPEFQYFGNLCTHLLYKQQTQKAIAAISAGCHKGPQISMVHKHQQQTGIQ